MPGASRKSGWNRNKVELSAVTESDARRIYLAVFHSSAGTPAADGNLWGSRAAPAADENLPFVRILPAGDENLWVGRILESWSERALFPASRYRDALRLLARTAMRFPGAETQAMVRMALDGLLELRQVLKALRSPGGAGSHHRRTGHAGSVRCGGSGRAVGRFGTARGL